MPAALLLADFPADVAAGIVVTRVAPGSPAAAAGLKEDDVIVAAAAAGAAPGQLVPTGLSVAALADALRDAIGGSLDLVVVREQRQQQQQGAAGAVQGGAGSSRYVYVTVTVRPVEAASG
jgi:S1-C subfamily serine protease